MAGVAKPTAREAFDDNLADAKKLVAIARALRNNRQRAMRRELRESVGLALGLPKRDWADLDCVESDDLFVLFKPSSNLSRDAVAETELRPLLRQAIVAVSAAVETFVADRAMEHYSAALNQDPVPPRLLKLTVSVEDWLQAETYTRKRHVLRRCVEEQIRAMSSCASSQIGITFSIVGVRINWNALDAHRGVRRGRSVATLDGIYARRNKIAHAGDRDGRGRAHIQTDDVSADLDAIESIVSAIDQQTLA